jgi:hypothetical protein
VWMRRAREVCQAQKMLERKAREPIGVAGLPVLLAVVDLFIAHACTCEVGMLGLKES